MPTFPSIAIVYGICAVLVILLLLLLMNVPSAVKGMSVEPLPPGSGSYVVLIVILCRYSCLTPLAPRGPVGPVGPVAPLAPAGPVGHVLPV